VLPQGAARRRFDAKVEVLSGRGYWREKLGPYIYRVSAPSFFQVNTALAETMAERVLTALRPDGADRVLDLFAGVGTFTLPIAERAGDVIAIEGTGSALRDLRSNLEDAELSAEVLGGDAARALKEAGRFDLAVVNPPRAGMSPDVTAALIATGAHRIVYVSCDPATLARDAKVLAANGLHLVSAVPVDLFPQTWHVETVALFERPAR
jgi:23S rRNA (uracil1939-C5)-methyltransferase